MKEFSKRMERIMDYPNHIFNSISMIEFACVKVEPIPQLRFNAFMLDDDFIDAAARHNAAHKERKEREQKR